MASFICRLETREYYQLVINAECYEDAVDIANDSDISEFSPVATQTLHFAVMPYDEEWDTSMGSSK